MLVVAATGVAVVLLRRRGLPVIRGNFLPNAVTALAFLIMIGFALRPYVQTVHAALNAPTQAAMTDWQRADGLPIQPTRLYYEISLRWVFWYLGVPAVVLGTAGAALLARRCLRGRAPLWTLPLITFAWTIMTTLYRPAIVPDQPWASRRLVPAVLPGFILLAVWTVQWLGRWLREQGYGRGGRAGVTALCAAALVGPPAQSTLGLAVSDGGPLGLRPTVSGLAFTPTNRGEVHAVDGLCAAIPQDAAVVIVDSSIADNFTQLIRGMCHVPTARMRDPRVAAVAKVTRGIRLAGHRPVLIAARRRELRPYGAAARHVMDLHSTQDGHTLVTPPRATWKLIVNVWMSEPPR